MRVLGEWRREGEAHTFISTLLQLPVMRCLLDEIEDRLGETFVGEGPGCVNVKTY